MKRLSDEYLNSQRWQKSSDEWVETMNKSRDRKKQLEMQQGYKVEIVFTTPLNAVDPFKWISKAVQEGEFKYQTNAIHTTSVEPIDIQSSEWKWLRDSLDS